MRVSAVAWNQFVDRIFTSRLLSVFTTRGHNFQHPWFTRVGWNDPLETFTCHIKPGFVFSEDTVEVTARGFDGEDVRLSDDPDLSIDSGTWRAIGTDALSFNNGGEPVPDFFRTKGVLDSPVISATAEGGVAIELAGLQVGASNARLLRACDIVLFHDRLQTATTWTEEQGETDIVAQFNIILTTPPNIRKEGYIRIVSQFAPVVDPTPAEQILGGFVSSTFDSIHIATLYLLSPPAFRHGSIPDSEVWQGYVDHHVYWNMRFWQQFLAPPIEPTILQVPAPNLGGGALGAAGGPLVDIVNQNTALLEALLFPAEATGHFFTI